MTDIELLPLPDELQGRGKSGAIRDYARANVEANTEALRAEVDRLQEEIDNRWARGVHTCHDNCQRTACVLRRDNERLAEALRELLIDMKQAQSNMKAATQRDPRWEGCAEAIQPRVAAAEAALRDHDQDKGGEA